MGAVARRCVVLVVVLLAARHSESTTWAPIGPPGGIVRSISFARSNPDVVYAAVLGGGVFRSVDGGATWTSTVSGLASLRAVAVAADPADDRVAYVGTYQGGEPAGGVFKTIDGGATWVASGNGLTNHQITALRVDEAAALRVCAGTVFGGLFRTVDGGTTWQDVSSGIVTGSTVIAIEIDAASDIFLSIAQGGNGAPAVVRSANAGGGWSRVDAGLPAADPVTTIAAAPGSSTSLLAGTGSSGIFRSSNGGASWTASSAGLPAGYCAASLAFDPADPSSVFSGDDEGEIYQSNDGGTHWALRKSGAAPSIVMALAVRPVGHAALAGTSDAGIFRSTDGAQWTPANSGIRGQAIATLAIGPADERVAYAAGAVGGLNVTRDGGVTWVEIDHGLPESLSYDTSGWVSVFVAAIAADPSDAATLYAGLNELGPGTAPGGGGLFKSTDGGATWKSSAAGITDGSFPISIGHLAIDPSHPSTIYAAAEGRGLFRSTDGAASWSPVAGLPFAFVNGVAVDPGLPSTVLAVTSQGLYRSTDSGGHFARSDSGFPASSAARAFAFDPAHPQRILAGTFGGAMFASEDGGATWTEISTDLAPHGVTGLAFAASSGTFFAGTEDAGIFRSTDGGAHWSPASDGLATPRVLSLVNRSGSERIYAALFGGGVVATGPVARAGRGPIIPVPEPSPRPVDRNP